MTVVAGKVRVNRPYFFKDVDGDRADFPSFGVGQADLEGADLRLFNLYTKVKQIQALEPEFPPENINPPAVTGTAEIGETLTTTNGDWSGSTPLTYTYEWLSSPNGTSSWTFLNGRTASTCVIPSGETGKYIACEVKATNSHGSSTQFSNAVGPIEA